MMRTVRTCARLGGVAVVRAAAFTVGVGIVAAFGFGAQDVLLMTTPANADTALTITGDVTGVVPGGPGVPLMLTLHNAGDLAAPIHQVSTAVTGPAGCAGYLTVGTWQGTVTVPAGGSATVRVPVRLAATTPDTCASAVFGLAYSAQ